MYSAKMVVGKGHIKMERCTHQKKGRVGALQNGGQGSGYKQVAVVRRQH